MLRKFSVLAIIMACSTYAFTQDSTKKSSTTITGSVDGYYRYNFHNAKDEEATNNLTSFTGTQNSFELGMASVKIEHTMGKVGGVLDLGFGKRAEEFSYNDQGTLAAIKQAYVYFAPSEHVKFTLGKWGTHVGFELLDAYLNRNYSMSYMFTNGPFFHTGLKADFTFNTVGFMIGVANPTDMVTANFGKKYILGQFSAGSKDGKLKGYLNFVGGKSEDKTATNQFDLVLTGVVSPKFNIGLNGTIATIKPDGGDSKSWSGAAIYLNVDPSPMLGITLRTEYFDDKKGVSTGAYNTSIVAATLSFDIKIDNLTIIPEFRLDSSKDPVLFVKKDGSDVKSTSTFLLGATYHF